MRLLLVLVLAAASAATVALASLRGGGQDPAYVAEHPVAVPETPRVVTVSRTMPLPSAAERNLSAMLVDGELPPAPATAEVLTDTECTPDERMISRCRNELRLADGTRVVLRHPHDMTKVPCLAPGEHVRLVPSGV